MRRALIIAGCAIGLATVAPRGAGADGGPVPPVQGGAGVTAPGDNATYYALGAGRSTVVERMRRTDGVVERSRVLPGRFGVPGVAYDGTNTGVSADGRTLVLAQTIRRYPVRRTRLVILDTHELGVRARVTLPGWFSVDAISPTGRWLYFIHYTSQNNATRYEVRGYDLEARRLLAKPIVDAREPEEKMQGIPVTRTASADGRWVYTLYQRGSEAPFVHALDTQRRRAVCVDLPPAAITEDLSTVRLALDGHSTLRIERNGAPLALIDTRTFAVRPAPVARAETAAAPTSDGGSNVPWPLA